MPNQETKEDLMNFKNAREAEQVSVMQRALDNKVCPFCEENIENYHPKPILFKTKYWMVTENAWPYKMTRFHFLLVYRPDHATNTADLKPEAFAEFNDILKRLQKDYGLVDGTILMRFGDTEKTGATVKHIHAQIIIGDKDHPEYDPKVGISTRIG